MLPYTIKGSYFLLYILLPHQPYDIYHLKLLIFPPSAIRHTTYIIALKLSIQQEISDILLLLVLS